MISALVVQGSNQEVIAPHESGMFAPEKRRDICITAVSADEDLPLHVRKALVGVTLSSVSSSEQVGGAASQDNRLACAEEVADALRAAHKGIIAYEFLAAMRTYCGEGKYHGVVFKKGEYEFVESLPPPKPLRRHTAYSK